jgi:tyrosine aminotransferase
MNYEIKLRCHQVRKGLQSLSQRIIGSSTVLQGALSRILTQTPPEFFQSTIGQVYVRMIFAYPNILFWVI